MQVRFESRLTGGQPVPCYPIASLDDATLYVPVGKHFQVSIEQGSFVCEDEEKVPWEIQAYNGIDYYLLPRDEEAGIIFILVREIAPQEAIFLVREKDTILPDGNIIANVVLTNYPQGRPIIDYTGPTPTQTKVWVNGHRTESCETGTFKNISGPIMYTVHITE